MDMLWSRIQNWLEFWKQNCRIHCAAATEGKAGGSKAEALQGALEGPHEELREKTGVCWEWEIKGKSVLNEAPGEVGVKKMHLLLLPAAAPASAVASTVSSFGALTGTSDVSR